MSDNIKVVVKVRPLISREIEDKLSYQWRVRDNTLNQLDQNGREFGSSFTFDKVYDKDTKTREVYNDIAKPIVEAAIAGFNGTIFAYGQTSSGKTYTMAGTENSPGIIPLAVLNLFEIIKTVPDRDFLVRVSYIEIYNETLKDLLDVTKKNIKIHESLQGVKVDATEKVTSSPEEVLDAMKEGEANRQTGATNMNEESSRSHSIFQITIESREHIEGEEEAGCVNVSQLNLVDLAGSERAGQTGATGLRFKEGTHINKSLSVLALVIKQLSEDPNKYANYRDSKLTRILQNSLGGNAKTSIICAITPASVEETISTLQFANRAKAIKNKPEVNAVATDATMIQSLTKQLSKLQSQLESKKNVEQNNATLQKQIANLRKLILNGFGQKSSIDMMGTSRRKQQPPRRITISTLHPIEEDPVPTVPRFCTPTLKYNPMLLSREFLPIQNASKPCLSSLPEEARMITPPPPDKGVNFGTEIIELDSDDDTSEVKTCSPYHKCYGSSKTPPCILRKNAKQAEKSLKDIMDLTEREKMYSPNVVELMEKLEQNTNVIARLEGEIHTLNEKGKEKDLELDLLRNKISKTEEQVTALTNTKTDLEILCNNYDTKVTDWEVSYETLKKKAKSREEDLLSLLEEQKIFKKVEDIGKLSRTLDKEQLNFMDISKDISLVNSENSIANANDDDSSTQVQELLTDLQSQLSSKSQAVLELETNIFAQKQKIESLENTSRKLQAKVDSFKEKISEMEIENSYLKSTVGTLNSTINNQKDCLETANKDISSFNSMIEDLQIKLNKKDNLLNMKITDSTLETMIANEERFIANNDNIKNIIHSFKVTLDSRNKEIENLKSTIQASTDLSGDYATLKEQVESKEKHINTLIEEVEIVKGQLNENIEMINKLMSLEKQLCDKVRDVEEQNVLLQKNFAEKATEVVNLKEQNEKLSNTVSEKDAIERDIKSTNNYLTKQIEDMSLKIVDLERDISLKDNLISSRNNIDDDAQKYLFKANSTLIKVHKILTILKCNTQDIPEAVDSFELFLNTLENNLNILESKSIKISEDNKQTAEKTLVLKEQMSSLLEKYQSETEGLQIKIENLNKERNEILNQYEDLSDQIMELTQEIDNVRQQQDEKHLTNINLEIKLNEARESNENLRNDLLSKDDLVLCLQEKISALSNEVESISQNNEQNHNEMKQKIYNLNANQESLEQMLKDRDVEISHLQNTLEEQRVQVSALSQELNESRDSRDHLLNNILDKISKVTHEFNIENNISSDIDNNRNVYEKILLTVDNIANHIIQNDYNQTNTTDVLSEAKEQIANLTKQNLKLMEAYAEIEVKNQELISEMENIVKINAELSATSELLEQLGSELKVKARELDNINANQKSLQQMLKDSDIERSRLQNALEEQCIHVSTITQELKECRENRDHLLNNILDKVLKVTLDFSIENNISYDLENIYEKILITVDKIASHMINNTNPENNFNQADMKKVLSEAKEQIADLAQKNCELMEAYSEIDMKNQELFAEMEEIKKINGELSGSSELLEQLKAELKVKATELNAMEGKAYELKDKFTEFECVVKKQMKELQAENELIKERVAESDTKTINQANVNSSIRKSISNFVGNAEMNSPQSLLTICCNRIIEAMEPDENDIKSVTTSSSKGNFAYQNTGKEIICECAKLMSELQIASEENSKLKDELQHLEFLNQVLIKEREEVCKEIQLLVEPAKELQKKIINHRTNMSTLTATTYAENKLLNSQLKVLKHHHTRYIHVCQRDIPAFKTQLHELMGMLKGTPSLIDKQNVSFKRYSLPDVLDSNSTVSNFKNESSLDGDLLMLDTNVTLATSADNTLLGNDQTCLDITQINFDSEVACQTNDSRTVFDPCLVYSQVEILTSDNEKMCEKLQALQEENLMLKDQIDKYSELGSNAQKVDAHSSPIKINGSCDTSLSNTLTENICICKDRKHDNECEKDKLIGEITQLSQELIDVKAQKEDIEKKYANLTLEIPSTDALVKKLCILEKEYNGKRQEIIKLTSDLSKKNKMIKDLQEENDSLSNQVMDNISEADDLRKELDMLKEVTNELKQLDHLEKVSKGTNRSECPQCKVKDEVINTLQSKQTSEAHTKLDRSLSEIDSSSRFTKIYTLQNELDASKEDCKKITEEVATIKNHLDRSNLSMSESMDLDGSIGDSNIFTFTKNYDEDEPNLNKFNMPNIPEERPSDMYNIDKIDCFNYFVEKTGANKDNLNCDVKIIDVMKMLYETIVIKHGNEVENLVNKLKDFDESKNQLQTQIQNVSEAYSKTTKDLELKDDKIKAVTNVLSQIRSNLKIITETIPNVLDSEKNTKFVTMFKESLLKVFDTEFDLSSVNIFESLIDSIVSKHQNDLNGIMKQYAEMQQHMETVVSEFETVNDNLTRMKSQLSDKENEYSLLKAQKERVHEISNAVTKDIVELNETIAKGCKRLLEHGIVSSVDVDLTQSLSKNLNIIFERLINLSNDQNKSDLEKEKECLMLEVNNSKMIIEEKEQQLEILKTNLLDAENKLQAHLSLQDDINKLYENKIEENKSNVEIIEKLTQDIQVMQKTILEKDATIRTLETELKTQKDALSFVKQTIVTGETQRIQDLLLQNEQLQSINDIITKEKEAYSVQLANLSETIKKNKIDLDRMTADILILRETIKDNVSVIESLTLEAKSLLQENEQMKKQCAEKCQNCIRLENNIKTHEKTAEIQNRRIIRLQKQKEQDEQAIGDKNKQLEELIQKCADLQKESDNMKLNIKASRDEIDGLKSMKLSLETRVSDLEMEVEHVNKNRFCSEGSADGARRRRQSLHDSQRVLPQDFEDHNNMEAVFGSRCKPDDLFMDVDGESSNRSTPNRLSRGRESFPSRPDQSDKDDESRPSSVLATRRRRQSTHDLQRSVVLHTPSPRESLKPAHELKDMKTDVSGRISNESEVSHLRQCLASCQQELEELRQQYKELDEECETCAEYLRERDEQCNRLKKEKTALQKQVDELNDKLKANLNRSEAIPKPCLKHASVNTDEDWANLHSVVVDRMSFDAEVEKNKKLSKAIEELRYNKQELKTTLAKMQKAMEKHSGYKDSRELEVTKKKLASCQQELEELRQQYKELDEECETCAEYLRERDEQCLKLKQAKAALEAKLQELQEDSGSVLQSVRKKRQSQHDQNRASPPDLQDAATETSEDLLSYQVERDESSHGDNALARELKQVRAALEKVSREKTGLEQMLASVPPTMFVATGSAIVQNQQLTDVMKENHKLKKINAKLINICRKRGKSQESNRENEEPTEIG